MTTENPLALTALPEPCVVIPFPRRAPDYWQRMLEALERGQD